MGEPCECEQEAVNSVVMAGCTNGTVERAEPTVADADVDGMALLGREPAERARGISEGDETEREAQSRLQESKLLCGEKVQRNGNANENIPSTNGLPLEGEWTGYASGETRDPKGCANALNATPECVQSASGEVTNSKGNTNAFNAAIEHADGSDESTETANTKDIKSEGCKRGTSEQESVDEANGDPGRDVEPTDTANELMQLLITTVKPYIDNGDVNARVCLGAMHWCADDANGLGIRTDRIGGQMEVSEGQADGSKGLTDAPSTSNGPETANVSHGDDTSTYLGVGDAKRAVLGTDGVGCHADASVGRTDTPSIRNETRTPANVRRNVRTHQTEAQT